MSRQALWPSVPASQLLRTPAGRSIIRFCAFVDPAAGDQGLEQRAVEPARGAVTDVLDRLMAQPGIAQPDGRPTVHNAYGFAIERQGESFRVRELGALRVGLQLE